MARIARYALVLLLFTFGCSHPAAPPHEPPAQRAPRPRALPVLLTSLWVPGTHTTGAGARVVPDVSTPMRARRSFPPRTARLPGVARPPDPETDLPTIPPPEGEVTAPAPAVPAWLPGSGPWMAGALVAQTERLDLYVGQRTFSAEQIAALAPVFEQALRAGEARFGTTLERRVSIAFYRTSLAPIRNVRGLAYTDEGRVEVFYQPDESLDRAVTVVAHELAHHLEAQRYGDEVQRRADTILHEGMATWIAGDRWLPMCSARSWKERARRLRDAGIPARLLTVEQFGPNNAYEMWASFVDFLVERYGWERVDALYRSGSGRAPGSSDYQGVIGKPLDEVADEWRAWLDT